MKTHRFVWFAILAVVFSQGALAQYPKKPTSSSSPSQGRTISDMIFYRQQKEMFERAYPGYNYDTRSYSPGTYSSSRPYSSYPPSYPPYSTYPSSPPYSSYPSYSPPSTYSSSPPYQTQTFAQTDYKTWQPRNGIVGIGGTQFPSFAEQYRQNENGVWEYYPTIEMKIAQEKEIFAAKLAKENFRARTGNEGGLSLCGTNPGEDGFIVAGRTLVKRGAKSNFAALVQRFGPDGKEKWQVSFGQNEDHLAVFAHEQRLKGVAVGYGVIGNTFGREINPYSWFRFINQDGTLNDRKSVDFDGLEYHTESVKSVHFDEKNAHYIVTGWVKPTKESHRRAWLMIVDHEGTVVRTETVAAEYAHSSLEGIYVTKNGDGGISVIANERNESGLGTVVWLLNFDGKGRYLSRKGLVSGAFATAAIRTRSGDLVLTYKGAEPRQTFYVVKLSGDGAQILRGPYFYKYDGLLQKTIFGITEARGKTEKGDDDGDLLLTGEISEIKTEMYTVYERGTRYDYFKSTERPRLLLLRLTPRLTSKSDLRIDTAFRTGLKIQEAHDALIILGEEGGFTTYDSKDGSLGRGEEAPRPVWFRMDLAGRIFKN